MKGTNKYLNVINNGWGLSESEYSCTKWNLERQDEYFKISHSIIQNKYLYIAGNDLAMGLFIDNDSYLFELIECENGSFYIKPKNINKYLKIKDDKYYFEEIIDEDYLYQFYLEKANDIKFFEENFGYTEDGKKPINATDRLLNTFEYSVNSVSGLISSVTDPMGNTTYYNYDSKNNLSSVKRGQKEIVYGYDSYNNLKNITQSDRIYNIIYDDFFNISSLKIGDNITLYTNDREENNGKINSVTYGNNQKIEYSYDSFDRVVTKKTSNNKFEYFYGAYNELLKISANNYIEKFSYDLKKRLTSYKNDDLSIKYSYDQNSNINQRMYKFKNINTNICSNYDYDNEIIDVTFENKTINYDFDDLGRMKSRNISNVL